MTSPDADEGHLSLSCLRPGRGGLGVKGVVSE